MTSVLDEDLKRYLDLYLEILREFFKDDLVSVYVFGSVARGEASEESDVDLLVVVKGLEEDVGKRLKLSSSLKELLRKRSWDLRRTLRKKGLPTTISDVLLTPEEVQRHPPILLDLVIDGIPLIDEGGFLAQELERLKERLRELKAVRVKSKHGWYWILKPGARLGEVIKV
ncbi:MAG: nucleotidyltransferase domain-containing protein [Candidatus Nezhaarchaeales archaeon]